ncbi:cyclic-phosphate processing receiver domain-containing protein [Salsuginibacillus kocurii]|uniref:cyclic-phosphate processing receiver domain-containing protein n=1 Tax=Salsuginibacillus kocurii TaxID=427078 RepID=UPI0003802D52|nr:cyclic-phosphate processing receiver domain-containing protein [Salsuginibacillus kocurii]
MERMQIFMDDIRPCPEDHILARTAEECVDLLREENSEIAHISLDHDLGSKRQNGQAVVEYMISHQVYAERMTVHSANAIGGKIMYELLVNARKDGIFPSYVKVYHRPLPLR